jgi:cytochrome c-type biogenesis protein CcsB
MSGLLFNAAFGFYVVGLFHSGAAFASRKDVFFRVALISVAIAFGFHTAFLIFRGLESALCPLTGLKESLALFAWTVTLCFLIAYARYRIKALGLFLLPLVAVLMLGTASIKSSPIPEMLRNVWIYLHSMFLFLAYSMFFVTFIAGLLYLLQERELKAKKPKAFYYNLPSLRTLDDLFQRFLIVGFVLMTAGLLVGIIQAEKAWDTGWFRDPKVISATITWAIYLSLIYARVAWGWRGRRAAWLSLIGFLSVLITFLGVSYWGGQHVFTP